MIEIDEIDATLAGDIDASENIMESDETRDIGVSEEFLNQERDSYIKIDAEFGRFLKNFVDLQEVKENQKIELKEQFFWIIMIGFLIMVLTPAIVVLSVKHLSDIAFVISLISVLVELISAIIILPKVIAKYLFNKKEDANMMKIIKSMQKYNEKKHMYIDKGNKKDGSNLES